MKSLPAVKYQMKHSKFVGICMNVLDCMREDIAILEQHSITEEKIHEVEILFSKIDWGDKLISGLANEKQRW